MPEIRVDLFLEISKNGKCLLTSSFLNVLLFWFPAGQGLKKLILVLFLKSKLKFRMILSKQVIQTLLL